MRSYYNLFPKVEGFRTAIFYLNPDSSLRVQIAKVESGVLRDTIIERFSTLSQLRYHCSNVFSIKTQSSAAEVQKVSLTTSSPVRIKLLDGSELIGTIIVDGTTSIKFKTASQIEMIIPRNQIQTIEDVSGQILMSTIRTDDPNRSKLLFSPTARPIEDGRGYVGGLYIFLFPAMIAGIGIGNILSLNGGLSLLPDLWAEGEVMVMLHAKGTIAHVDNFFLAAGVLYFSITGRYSRNEGFGIGYGVVTVGTNDNALTFGAGFDITSNETSPHPLFLVGGDIKVANGFKLVSEILIPSNPDDALGSFGVRIFGDNLAGELGIFFPISGNDYHETNYYPCLSFSYNF